MPDSLDVTRIDALPGRTGHDGVDSLRRPADQQRRRRRPPPHPDQHEDEEDEERQVGTKLDIRV